MKGENGLANERSGDRAASLRPDPKPGIGRPNMITLFFSLLLAYIIIFVLFQATQTHVKTYEVISGSISGNYRFTALALKDEQIVTAHTGGYVRYHAKDGVRTGVNSTICSLVPMPDTQPGEGETAQGLDFGLFRQEINTFALNYSNVSFQDVQSFKENLESLIVQSYQTEELPDSDPENPIKAPVSGFICYSIDQMESLTEEDLSLDLFNRSLYSSQNLRLASKVEKGDPVFKLIKGEDWNLYFPVTEQMVESLKKQTSMRFRFLKDDTTFRASFSFIRIGNIPYGRIRLHNSLVRFVPDRFVEIELLPDRETGLKIPSSAVVNKHFYRISPDYIMPNLDNENEVTIYRETFGKDGSSILSYVTVSVYGRMEGDYLLDTSSFNQEDYLLMPDGDTKHKVVDKDLVEIRGVYNINQRYAIFRQVSVEAENEEFCVVKPDSVYGLAAHDFIALDASAVSDNDVI